MGRRPQSRRGQAALPVMGSFHVGVRGGSGPTVLGKKFVLVLLGSAGRLGTLVVL
jgi:hypothetical protein